MRINQREVFIADDGMEFLVREECQKHDRKIRVAQWVERNHFADMSKNDLVEAILDTKDDLFKALV